jgi:uncharacterized membrane protein YgcG
LTSTLTSALTATALAALAALAATILAAAALATSTLASPILAALAAAALTTALLTATTLLTRRRGLGEKRGLAQDQGRRSEKSGTKGNGGKATHHGMSLKRCERRAKATNCRGGGTSRAEKYDGTRWIFHQVRGGFGGVPERIEPSCPRWQGRPNNFRPANST